MARLQILELPEGSGDDRPPFVLVIDQYEPVEATPSRLIHHQDMAEKIGARAVLFVEDTIDIPANDTTAYLRDDLPPDAYRKLDSTKEEPEGDLNCRDEVTDTRDAAEFYGPKLRHLGALLDEARVWARHGYEIGQKHCGWTDHDVAPDWLTEDWPPHFNTCEHLKRAAELEESEAIRKRVANECKAALTDALGMDRTRDWDDIRNAARAIRKQRDAESAAIERVRQLHKPVLHRDQEICWACSAYDFVGKTTDNAPIAHSQCGTLQALRSDTERSPEE